jgi:hypothetical protein
MLGCRVALKDNRVEDITKAKINNNVLKDDLMLFSLSPARKSAKINTVMALPSTPVNPQKAAKEALNGISDNIGCRLSHLKPLMIQLLIKNMLKRIVSIKMITLRRAILLIPFFNE